MHVSTDGPLVAKDRPACTAAARCVCVSVMVLAVSQVPWRLHATCLLRVGGSTALVGGVQMPVESLHNWLTLNCMPPTGTTGADHLGATP